MEKTQDARFSLYKVRMWWLTGEWAGAIRFLVACLIFGKMFLFLAGHFFVVTTPARGEVLIEHQTIFWPGNARTVSIFENEHALPEVGISLEEYKDIVRNTPEILTFVVFNAHDYGGPARIDYYGKTALQTHVFHSKFFFPNEAHSWGEYLVTKVESIDSGGQLTVTKTFGRNDRFYVFLVLLFACCVVVTILTHNLWQRRLKKKHCQMLNP